ncbi:MAG: single-stranded DNA-binding protein [Lentisphaerae bacterium]|nr:single-stranded DNA-binding protein [Lentisphaerota bacterium]MCP4100194.1 single-stranded DNA-binding protein [Lentisphaerota bacterium]
MASLNKVFLIGNLTREPELRYTPGGAAVCEFGMAINRKFTSNNQDKEETCFVEIVVWGKQAESCQRYLDKGAMAMVEGRLQLDQWEDRESGSKRSRMRVVAERVQFLNTRGSQQAGSGYQQQSNSGYQQNNGGSGYQQQNNGDSGNQQQNNGGSYQQNNGGGSHSAPQQNAAPNAQQGGNGFPPMPDNAFNVDDVEDDIPF